MLVSELMLQQTPVARVLPVHEQWLQRWPTPAALAAEPSGEAVRAWGRLGYPRRALRLHAAATAIVERYGGEVPADYDALLTLPGVGDYTAAAVASFAFGRRHVVLDTNVRRVFARALGGVEFPAPLGHPRRARARGGRAARRRGDRRHLGGRGHGARRPRVHRQPTPAATSCPIADQCAWRAAGQPAYDGPPRQAQAWAGTDRQCRGRLMAVLRDAEGPVHRRRLEAAWPDAEQRERCLQTLIGDGLVTQAAADRYVL